MYEPILELHPTALQWNFLRAFLKIERLSSAPAVEGGILPPGPEWRFQGARKYIGRAGLA